MSNSFITTDFAPGELPLPPKLQMTEDEYVSWVLATNANAEWVDGEVVMMSPANIIHQDLEGWLLSVLRMYCGERGLGTVLHNVLVRLSRRRRFRIPDILFVAKDREGIIEPTMLRAPPDMVVEIVSPDSVSRDWRDKYTEYEEFGIRECWIIDPQAQSFEVYLLDSTGKYQQIKVTDGEVYSNVIPGFWVKSEWFAPATRVSELEALRQLGVA
jgi:Uma2 family endonuclease